MKYVLPPNILLSLYNSLILPHINYCLLSWGQKHDAILLLQKRAMRSIFSAEYHCHTEPLFKICKSLRVEEIYKTRLFVFYHKLVHNELPAYFSSFKPSHSLGNERYQFRAPKYETPIHEHEFIKSTCRYQLTTVLNHTIIPEISSRTNEERYISNIILNTSTMSLNNFRTMIKTHLLSRYSYICSIPNCYTCERYTVA